MIGFKPSFGFESFFIHLPHQISTNTLQFSIQLSDYKNEKYDPEYKSLFFIEESESESESGRHIEINSAGTGDVFIQSEDNITIDATDYLSLDTDGRYMAKQNGTEAEAIEVEAL